jgi:hypothetical protein
MYLYAKLVVVGKGGCHFPLKVWGSGCGVRVKECGVA